MNKNPLISIITATYNAENFLESSIQSIVNQTYQNFEYIIIDGGSTDRTVQIIEDHKTVISHWMSEPDNGIYDAWNKGLNKAEGEWIVFLGADDQLLPDSLETYVNFITSNQPGQFDYISSRVRRIRPDTSIEGIVGKPWKWKEFKFRMTTAHPGSFHSSRLFAKTGTYNTEYKIVADYEILLRFGKDLKAGYIDKITVNMSTGGRFADSVSTQECIKMLKTLKHLSTIEYAYICTYLKLRTRYLNLLNIFK